MATLAAADVSPLQSERAFFFFMALAVVATVFAGFGFNFAMGISSVYSPWWVHLHALSMMTWVALFLAQTYLVYRGNVAAHRTLGPIAAGWTAWIVVLGLVVTVMDVRTHRVPPFFQPNFFLVMDWLNMIAFGGLVAAAVRLRRGSDWHKRLMLGAMLNLMTVAWGRIILALLFDERGVLAVAAVLLLYFATGMMFDRRTRGAVHPAYYWGSGVLVGWLGLAFALAWLPPVMGLTRSLAG